MHSPSLASERAERTPARAEGTRIERHEVRLAAEASMQPPTNARMPTLHFVCVCECACVLPWLRCCCCCCWFLLEGASCKAKLVACGCERSAPSSSVRHLPRNLRKIVTRVQRKAPRATQFPIKVFSACSKRSLTQLKSN